MRLSEKFQLNSIGDDFTTKVTKALQINWQAFCGALMPLVVLRVLHELSALPYSGKSPSKALKIVEKTIDRIDAT